MKFLVPVTFRGQIEVTAPDHESEEWCRQIAKYKALAMALATVDNPDCEEVLEDGEERAAADLDISVEAASAVMEQMAVSVVGGYWEQTDLQEVQRVPDVD